MVMIVFCDRTKSESSSSSSWSFSWLLLLLLVLYCTMYTVPRYLVCYRSSVRRHSSSAFKLDDMLAGWLLVVVLPRSIVRFGFCGPGILFLLFRVAGRLLMIVLGYDFASQSASILVAVCCGYFISLC